jgi:ankyrin repeat protein
VRDNRVQFETIDSSFEEGRKNEKLVFKLIQRQEHQELRNHLYATQYLFDVTLIFDKSGYSPLHFASYKNSDKICDILCEFIMLRFKIGSRKGDSHINNSSIPKEDIDQE